MTDVTVARVDLTRFLTEAVEIELADWQVDIIERLPTKTLSFSGYWLPIRGHDGAAYMQAAWDRMMLAALARMARLSRIHAAYRRRRR